MFMLLWSLKYDLLAISCGLPINLFAEGDFLSRLIKILAEVDRPVVQELVIVRRDQRRRLHVAAEEEEDILLVYIERARIDLRSLEMVEATARVGGIGIAP